MGMPYAHPLWFKNVRHSNQDFGDGWNPRRKLILLDVLKICNVCNVTNERQRSRLGCQYNAARKELPNAKISQHGDVPSGRSITAIEIAVVGLVFPFCWETWTRVAAKFCLHWNRVDAHWWPCRYKYGGGVERSEGNAYPSEHCRYPKVFCTVTITIERLQHSTPKSCMIRHHYRFRNFMYDYMERHSDL